MKTYNCVHCGKEAKSGDSKLNKYCSNKCHAAHRRAEILKEWLNGTYFNKKGVPPDIAKEWISEQQGHKCLLCGIKEWNGKPIVFQYDHIDGDPDNNTKENTRMICPNCHSQTDTYGVKNKNSKNSRRNIYRRQNYKNNVAVAQLD